MAVTSILLFIFIFILENEWAFRYMELVLNLKTISRFGTCIKMPFIKKKLSQFIYKEKSGIVTKLKLVQKKHNQKFKTHNQLCFGTLVETTNKVRTSFKTLAKTWRLKQSQSNDKFL